MGIMVSDPYPHMCRVYSQVPHTWANETVVEVLTTTGGCLDLDVFAATFLAIRIARCSPSCRDRR
jgi:hypothetical protein